MIVTAFDQFSFGDTGMFDGSGVDGIFFGRWRCLGKGSGPHQRDQRQDNRYFFLHKGKIRNQTQDFFWSSTHSKRSNISRSKKTILFLEIGKSMYLYYIEKAGAENSDLFTTTSLLNEE
jgi:hypothetical protein